MSIQRSDGRPAQPAVRNDTTPRQPAATDTQNGTMRSIQPQALAGQEGAPGRCAARGTRAGALAALAALATMALALPAAAHAGEWVQVSCINPNQSAAGAGGWSTLSEGAGAGSEASTECGPGSYAQALLATPVQTGAYETLQYAPPGGSTLNGGLLDLGLSAEGYGHGAWGTATAYLPEDGSSPEDVLLTCAVGYQACGPDSNSYIGQLEIPTGRGGRLRLQAGCGGSSGEECNEGGPSAAIAQVQLWWANLRLTNNALPSASAIGGTLLASEDRGTRELLLDASEQRGPGIYNLTVQAEGQTLYSGTPDSNDGQCVPVGESDGALMFDSSQPCKERENIDIPIETTLLRDGEHTLKITISDAAGNTAIADENTITTHNAPAATAAPSIAASQPPQAGTTLTAEHGQWQAPEHTGAITYSYQWQQCNNSGEQCTAIPAAEGNTYTLSSSDAGHTLRVLATAADKDGQASAQSSPTPAITAAPASTDYDAGTTVLLSPGGSPASALGANAATQAANGSPASENAQLHLTTPTRLTRGYGARALTVTGQLTTAAGTAIADATLTATERATGGEQASIVARASTTPNGGFTLHIPAGPSRTLTIGYRAYSTDADYAAQSTLTETVAAGVSMHITPLHSTPTGTITISGQVDGPVPRAGVTVELLVHYHGQWEPFRDPHTNAAGRFRVRYQFQGAEGRYPFRTQALGGQAGFPYSAGNSNIITITTR